MRLIEPWAAAKWRSFVKASWVSPVEPRKGGIGQL